MIEQRWPPTFYRAFRAWCERAPVVVPAALRAALEAATPHPAGGYRVALPPAAVVWLTQHLEDFLADLTRRALGTREQARQRELASVVRAARRLDREWRMGGPGRSQPVSWRVQDGGDPLWLLIAHAATHHVVAQVYAPALHLTWRGGRLVAADGARDPDGLRRAWHLARALETLPEAEV
jgi:hypothetical protein